MSSKKIDVITTTSYSKFNFLEGNRNLNHLHIARLKESMEKEYLTTIITVNERMEIIDGQHRFEAAKSLKLPIHYIVQKGYGIQEIQLYNTNLTNWNNTDFLNSYIQQGKEPYVKLKKFMKKFPEFGFLSSERIISLRSQPDATQKDTTQKSVRKLSFRNGELKVPNEKRSYELAQQIKDFEEYFPDYTKPVFVSAMIYLTAHPNYNHAQMLEQLKRNPGFIKRQFNVHDYKNHLEDLFNFNKKNKKNLRYAERNSKQL